MLAVYQRCQAGASLVNMFGFQMMSALYKREVQREASDRYQKCTVPDIEQHARYPNKVALFRRGARVVQEGYLNKSKATRKLHVLGTEQAQTDLLPR